jgi:hypothetical protein
MAQNKHEHKPHQGQATQSPIPHKTISIQKNRSTPDRTLMQWTTLRFVIGWHVISVIASGIIFLLTKNIEAALLPYIPSVFLHRIICYLFPSQENSHPLMEFLLTLFKIKH